jgi:hypothetical protein
MAREYVKSRVPHAELKVRNNEETDSTQFKLLLLLNVGAEISEEEIISGGEDVLRYRVEEMVEHLQRFAAAEAGLPVTEIRETWSNLKTNATIDIDYRDDGRVVMKVEDLNKFFDTGDWTKRLERPLNDAGKEKLAGRAKRFAHDPYAAKVYQVTRSRFIELLQGQDMGTWQLLNQQGLVQIVED